jgi:thiol-disulfide isomerase/thioredoxin
VLLRPGARPFDSAAFAQAQAENQIILVETYAPWCVTCRVQGPIIADLLRRPAFAGIAIFKVTAETPNSVWKQFKVRNYGALIVFRGLLKPGAPLAHPSPTRFSRFSRPPFPEKSVPRETIAPQRVTKGWSSSNNMVAGRTHPRVVRRGTRKPARQESTFVHFQSYSIQRNLRTCCFRRSR